MSRPSSTKHVLAIGLAIALIVSVFAFAGCSNSSEQSSSAEASSSAFSASDKPMYTVPNVVSLTQADAKKAILASGLQVGSVKKESSDTAPLGSVISQDPQPLTNAEANSKVKLVVSSGKKKAKDVVMPDLKGMWQADAEKALSDVGLVGVASNPEQTDEVQPGQVFKQSIDAGKTVKEGSKVAFTVAMAPAQTTVPDVSGMTADDAKAAITKANLGFDSTAAYNDSIGKGLVISQSISAGAKVNQGTTISVTVSLGPKSVADVVVPDVTTFAWTDAQAALRSAGLAARYTGDPAGVVVAQDVAAGTQVAPNTLVTVTLSTPMKMVEVPNLIGMTVSAAEATTDAAGLGLDASSWDGTVVDQWPAAGAQVEERTVVSVTVEDPQQDVGERFMGSWQAERASIEIQNVGGGFNVTVNWASSADESVSWEYVCSLQGNKLVSDNNGRKTEYSYDEDDGDEDADVIYNNGSATFSIDGSGRLIWKDNVENAGKGLKFEKIS